MSRFPLVGSLPAVLGGLLLAGCVETEKTTLNEVSLTGPVPATPINVTIDPVPGTVQVIPGVAISSPPLVRGSIDPSGEQWNNQYGPPPPSSPRGNLTWNVPGNQYSLDLQLTASEHVALMAGAAYTTAGGYQFTTFRGGLGFFTMGNQFGVRFDAGVQFNTIRYRSRATVTTVYSGVFSANYTRYVSNFDDSGTEQSAGVMFGLTINSALHDSRINGFLHVGLAWEPLFDYTPTIFDSTAGPGDGHAASSSVNSTTTVLTFAAGLSAELGGGHRVLFGLRGAQLMDVNTPVPRPILQPFVQLVFSF